MYFHLTQSRKTRFSMLNSRITESGLSVFSNSVLRFSASSRLIADTGKLAIGYFLNLLSRTSSHRQPFLLGDTSRAYRSIASVNRTPLTILPSPSSADRSIDHLTHWSLVSNIFDSRVPRTQISIRHRLPCFRGLAMRIPCANIRGWLLFVDGKLPQKPLVTLCCALFGTIRLPGAGTQYTLKFSSFPLSRRFQFANNGELY